MFDVEKIREEFPILHREVYGKPQMTIHNISIYNTSGTNTKSSGSYHYQTSPLLTFDFLCTSPLCVSGKFGVMLDHNLSAKCFFKFSFHIDLA